MTEAANVPRFSYADYEKGIRARYYDDQRRLSREIAARFQRCREVLDIASGQGLLLDSLQEIGVGAQGVDSEPELVADCRARGLNVTEDTVSHFLLTTPLRFDGAYCGHLVEHLPYEALLDMIEGIHRVLSPQGVVLIRWPNPRSAITQHYTFWQDPTHVRFYDGDFLKTVLEHYGFWIAETHYNTVKPLVYAAPEAGATSDTPPAAPLSRSGRLHAVVGRLLSLLRNGGRRFPPVQRLSSFAESLYARRQTATMSRLVFELPVEAYVMARRGNDPSSQ
jgi:SAM-dependent methyltransferase